MRRVSKSESAAIASRGQVRSAVVSGLPAQNLPDCTEGKLMLIDTAQGLKELSELDVEDIVEVGDNGVPYRKIATEYRLAGELVRRDVTATALRGIEAQSIQGAIS